MSGSQDQAFLPAGTLRLLTGKRKEPTKRKGVMGGRDGDSSGLVPEVPECCDQKQQRYFWMAVSADTAWLRGCQLPRSSRQLTQRAQGQRASLPAWYAPTAEPIIVVSHVHQTMDRGWVPAGCHCQDGWMPKTQGIGRNQGAGSKGEKTCTRKRRRRKKEDKHHESTHGQARGGGWMRSVALSPLPVRVGVDAVGQQGTDGWAAAPLLTAGTTR